MCKFDEDKLIWDSFQHNRGILYTAINILHKQGNITLETSDYLKIWMFTLEKHTIQLKI